MTQEIITLTPSVEINFGLNMAKNLVQNSNGDDNRKRNVWD